MEMVYMLSEKVLDTLKLEFEPARVERSSSVLFEPLTRGSFRLSKGLYRTEAEQDEFINDCLALPIPGVRNITTA
jgi:hypothetical protein